MMTPDTNQLEQNAADVAAKLGVLSNPARLLILCKLVEGPCRVGQLQEVCGLSQSALSQHLAKLRHQRMVATTREGQHIIYRCSDDKTRQLMEMLCELYG